MSQQPKQPDGERNCLPIAGGACSTALRGMLIALCVLASNPAAGQLELELRDLNGSNGFVVNGAAAGDESGWPVSAAGDVNGDGADDVLIGASRADTSGVDAGAGYVIFGAPGVGQGGVLELSDLDGSNGFVIQGVSELGQSGGAVSGAGDVNDDGFDDVLIDAGPGNPFGGGFSGGYVVFGGATVGASGALSLAEINGVNGTVTLGESGGAGDSFMEISVQAAGDLNDDGVDDLIVGDPRVDPNEGRSGGGYVLFGSLSLGSSGELTLMDLDGTNGLAMNGAANDDSAGTSVDGAGDINGDGIADVIVGAPFAQAGGDFQTGVSYVVFGGEQIGQQHELELATLNGANGFAIHGAASGDFSGLSVSRAGDINDDGTDDLVVGAPFAQPSGQNSGAAFVVFGGAGVGASGAVDLATLDGTNGFVMHGTGGGSAAGISVSGAGDVNDDGVDDLLIATSEASGTLYIVFGGAGLGSGGVVSLAALDGTNGLVLQGIAKPDSANFAVSAAGDVNADGIVDVLVGAPSTDGSGKPLAGATYVVFGTADGLGNGVVNLQALDGTDGFMLLGAFGGGQSGTSVGEAGDVNGDGIADLIVGSPGALNKGAAHIVFGRPGLGTGGTVDLATLDGSDGLAVLGIEVGERAGTAVSGAGDVNGDGIDDVVIGAPDAAPSGSDPTGTKPGASYVVFGGIDLGGNGALDLASLDGTNGFVLHSLEKRQERTPKEVSYAAAGDVNDDQVDDFIIGDPLVTSNGLLGAGASYVVFGSPGLGNSGPVDLQAMHGTGGMVFRGVASSDRTGVAVDGAGDVNGDGIDDMIIGAVLANPDGRAGAGISYVVFGSAEPLTGTEMVLSELDGTNGFAVHGVNADDRSGVSVSGLGDANGDGTDDLLIGAYRSDPNGSNSGTSYVVFGRPGIGATGVLDLAGLDGTNGFAMNGVALADSAGLSSSNAGDVNDDGFNDLLIGAKWSDPNGEDSGASYVVFGGPQMGGTGVLELSTLNGLNGFILNGVSAGERSGRWVSNAGDVNDDGVSDLVIGAHEASPGGRTLAGASYVVFGRRLGPGATVDNTPGASVVCVNMATGQRVMLPLFGKGGWDCAWSGLSTSPGEQLYVSFSGFVPGGGNPPRFNGRAFGYDGGPMMVQCSNQTTGQTVATFQSSSIGWDCVAAGLTINPGNQVGLVLVGRSS